MVTQLMEPTRSPAVTTYARGEQPRCVNEFKRNDETRTCNHPTSFHPAAKEHRCTAMGCRCPGLILPEDPA
jgi:hypothetical protein